MERKMEDDLGIRIKKKIIIEIRNKKNEKSQSLRNQIT